VAWWRRVQTPLTDVVALTDAGRTLIANVPLIGPVLAGHLTAVGITDAAPMPRPT
jgi:hypothetical protein